MPYTDNPHPNNAERSQEALTCTFDCTELMKYFKYSRVVTGIQRVQIQIIASALALEQLKHVFKIAFFIDN